MPEEGEEKGRGFKVEDRRRFSPEGELKPEYRSEHKAGPAQGAEKPSAPHLAQEEAAAVRRAEAEAEAAAEAAYEGSRDTITFASFIVGLSTEALAFLGEMPNPATGERQADLKAAEQIIDIIGILREKTRGNLDSDEESLMDAILFDLRMKYVEKARSPLR
jgi:hypothetical protein